MTDLSDLRYPNNLMKTPCFIWLGLLAELSFSTFASAQMQTKEETFTPANPPAMEPIADHHTPAYRAAKMFLHGVNLGDCLEAGKNRGVKVDADEFTAMKQQGFDHVRVPVGWQHYAGPAPHFTLEPEIFAKVDFCVTNALHNDLAVIINIHHFNELDRDPAGATDEFLKIWKQIAAHYKAFPNQLAFELDNEPHDQATAAVMNPVYAKLIAQIRESNPGRTLFVEPAGWGGINQLTNLVLPPDDNIIVSVHCYDPFPFTHQGAGWVGEDFRQTGIVFPGPPATPLMPDTSLNLPPWMLDWIKRYNTLPMDKNPSSPLAFGGKLDYARAWSDYYGRPVHIGEFGAYIKADERSRARFYEAFRQKAEADRLGWCIWDWSANFRYWDRQKHAPLPGLHDALFGKRN